MERIADLDDLALVRAIRHGDEAAIAEFYQRFAPGLSAYLRLKVQTPADIEDILAETMTAAVKAILRFQGHSKVFTWLCRIAEFKMVDHYRRLGKSQWVPLDEAVVASAFDPRDLETNLVICQVLLGLRHEYRQVLEAKYFAGFSTREIAARLKKSEKAVEATLNRARQAFAREYRRLAPDEEV